MSAELYYLLSIALAIIAGIAAVIAFIKGREEYRTGQHWQKAQVVLSLIDSFDDNELIAAAAQMIDWDEREILIKGHIIQFKNENLISALRTPRMDISSTTKSDTRDIVFSKEECAIRDAFDAFFDYFDKLYYFQERKLLTIDDYSYFKYLLELLSDIGNQKQDEKIRILIDNYIKAYCFSGVRKLIDQYRSNGKRIVIGLDRIPVCSEK